MLSLLRLDCKQKNPSSPFRISIFLFLSYSFGIKVINTFIYSRSSLENPTLFQTKMSKVFCILRPRHCKNPTWWGSTYLYSLCKGVPPPLGGRGEGGLVGWGQLSWQASLHVLIVSLHNRIAGRRERQNACVWQTWQSHYTCELCLDLPVTLILSGLLQKGLFNGGL